MIHDCKNLSNLSKILTEKVKECVTEDKNGKYKLIDLVDDLLIVWCKEEGCLYTQILQNVQATASDGENHENQNIQMMALSKPPLWDVHNIILNKNATGILLVGKEGVGVVELPQRWGSHPLFEGGLETLTCRVEYVGENFFAFNPHVKIIAADWHPGSVDNSFLVILSSDNYLRIYSALCLDFPEQAIAVANKPQLSKESSKFGIREGAVAFGIGPPIGTDEEQAQSSNQTKSSGFAIESPKETDKIQELLWPLFILYNNGDVYYTLTSLKRSLRRRVLFGPLRLLPISFDNYGVDFCSLLVLPSSPVVLVIANTKGFLHHCIVMETGLSEDPPDDTCQEEDLVASVNKLNLEPPEAYLHVYESIVLNMSLAEPSSSHISQISLIPDANTPARYWVSHSEGCYAVSLPLVERLLPESEDMDFPGVDLECRVEHLLCTRPVASSSPCSVLGMCVAPTSSTLFALLSSGNIQTIPPPALLLPHIPSFHLQSPEPEASPFRKVYAKSFEEHIRSILQRTSSQPLLLSGSLTGASLEECLALVTKVTNNLRENYIPPLVKVREEINKRRKILVGQKEHLKKELVGIASEKASLTAKAHELAEKYEEANDRHAQLMKRLEIVSGNLVRKMPYLTASEKGMLKELQDMTDGSKNLQLQLNQIEAKFKWQSTQIEKEKKNQSLRARAGSSLSDNQLTCLKMSLGKESDKLGVLVKKVNSIKKAVGL